MVELDNLPDDPEELKRSYSICSSNLILKKQLSIY